MKRIGLVGARGHVGRELIRLLAGREDMGLAFASSRAMAGAPATALAPEAPEGLTIEALGPEGVAGKDVDAVVLALPNGEAAPYVAAIEAARPGAVIVDLSADYRFDDAWAYGLPELQGRERLRGATRIANPGCYATAGQFCVAPVRDRLAGPAHLFGVSGYSGAGTSPSRRNDPVALADNLMPYGLTGHLHEREMSRHLGGEVRFSPHVAAFFRGLIVTAQLEFADPLDEATLRNAYVRGFADEPLIEIVEDRVPEITDGANQNGAAVGGFALGEDGRRAVMVCALDNLLKGAAVQAIQNLALALELDEFDGLV
ncbi:N-acetyl-gamma-glutamyl-phosphate reductase [Marinicauda salina]|uniref:N-acetyl-gamma-glutamyl-phosphate reductase n=1 Tax=Marinicauda salina TaxID=2135793 RepID=A0A2U2BQV0_9PROT|nr:N-acetyl-gamma-glutamyl-phosphate reductase [Marinicauda salina]PWE16390.1 N-acetyl-gamma-glutamyl-phosphate reductase [Marinicauda salina]